MSNMTNSGTHLDLTVQPTFMKRPRSLSGGWDRCCLHDREHGFVKLVFLSWQSQSSSSQLSQKHLWTIRVERRLFNWRRTQTMHGSVPRIRLPARTSPRPPLPSNFWIVTWTVDPLHFLTVSSQSRINSCQSTSPMTQLCEALHFD